MRNIIIIGVIMVGIGGIGWFAYKIIFPTTPRIFFKTQKPEKRDIYKVVHAEGSLEAKGTSKLGPLINATVKKIYVKEGQKVAQGMLLADLTNDKGGDLDVRQAKAQLEQAQAMFTYVAAVHERSKALYNVGEMAKEAFEKDCQTYQHADAEVRRMQAVYDKEVFLFKQTHVHAPHDGIVVAINVKEGETVSPVASPPIVLFEIAQDLETMKATLYIDESKVGDVKVGMQAEISVDTYPSRQPWVGRIDSIGMSRAINPASQEQQGVTYKAEVLINNADGLLRQGMSVHAKATIGEVSQVLAVPGFAFQLNSKVLEAAAKALHYTFKPLDEAKKRELLKMKGKTLWVVENKAFAERAVEIGITDSAYFQILSGVQESDEIIADDMTASEELKKLAKQIVGS